MESKRTCRGGVRRLCMLMLVAVALVGAALSACNTTGCLENRSSIPLAGFYSSDTGDAVTLDSLRVTGIGKEDGTAMAEEGTMVGSVYLPMRSTQHTTSWQLAYKWQSIAGGVLCDTITFDYDSDPYFASDECGVIFRYHITRMSYTTHIIDSVVITDSLVTNTDIERIKIFFRTE